MELSNLFKEQKMAEKAILQTSIADSNEIMAKKLLTLQAELGTLAIYAGCCNIPDTKESLTKQGLLDKYIVCFHLIISLGIEKDYTGFSVESKLPEYNLAQQFLNLFININDFVVFSYRDVPLHHIDGRLPRFRY